MSCHMTLLWHHVALTSLRPKPYTSVCMSWLNVVLSCLVFPFMTFCRNWCLTTVKLSTSPTPTWALLSLAILPSRALEVLRFATRIRSPQWSFGRRNMLLWSSTDFSRLRTVSWPTSPLTRYGWICCGSHKIPPSSRYKKSANLRAWISCARSGMILFALSTRGVGSASLLPMLHVACNADQTQ